jgi:hypothetical protein
LHSLSIFLSLKVRRVHRSLEPVLEGANLFSSTRSGRGSRPSRAGLSDITTIARTPHSKCDEGEVPADEVECLITDGNIHKLLARASTACRPGPPPLFSPAACRSSTSHWFD